LRTLESGGNVTLHTFEKIVAQLPNLKELIIGGVRVTITGVNIQEVRAAIKEADLASRRLLELLDIVRAHAPEPFADATLAERLAELENRMQTIQGRAAGG
jgi:DNA-binding transcriptional MerR regulator